jgi:hypothetical protein
VRLFLVTASLAVLLALKRFRAMSALPTGGLPDVYNSAA